MASIHVYLSHSSEETKKIAQQFTKKLSTGSILCLYGDLGSGKTTFVQRLAEGLGIKKRIISPTFTIVRHYKASPARCDTLYHIDLYRIHNKIDLKSIGIEEILSGQNSIIAIEWAEKLGPLLPKKRWDVRFEYIDEEKRKITIVFVT